MEDLNIKKYGYKLNKMLSRNSNKNNKNKKPKNSGNVRNILTRRNNAKNANNMNAMPTPVSSMSPPLPVVEQPILSMPTPVSSMSPPLPVVEQPIPSMPIPSMPTPVSSMSPPLPVVEQPIPSMPTPMPDTNNNMSVVQPPVQAVSPEMPTTMMNNAATIPAPVMNQPIMNTKSLAAEDFKITYLQTATEEKLVVGTDTPMTQESTQDVPYIKLGETLVNNLKSGKQYLLVMYDVNAVGGTFVHMVVHFTASKMRGIMKVKYLPPTPPAGTGNHKYVFELLDYEENPQKMMNNATYLSSLASDRTLKKLQPETPDIATNLPGEAGDIGVFYEKMGVASSGRMKSMMVAAASA